MIFLFVSIAVPLVVYISASFIVQRSNKDARQYRGLLLLACVLFFISWYLPSPLIDGKDTAFTTHFVGGGLFCGLLWLYFKYSLGLRYLWYVEAAIIYCLVSALGVANELFELAVVQIGITHLALSDTSWDLLSNTFGALSVYLVSRLFNQKSL